MRRTNFVPFGAAEIARLGGLGATLRFVIEHPVMVKLREAARAEPQLPGDDPFDETAGLISWFDDASEKMLALRSLRPSCAGEITAHGPLRRRFYREFRRWLALPFDMVRDGRLRLEAHNATTFQIEVVSPLLLDREDMFVRPTNGDLFQRIDPARRIPMSRRFLVAEMHLTEVSIAAQRIRNSKSASGATVVDLQIERLKKFGMAAGGQRAPHQPSSSMGRRLPRPG